MVVRAGTAPRSQDSDSPNVCALPFLLGAVLVPSSAPHAVEVFTSPQVAFTEGGLSVLGRFNGRNSQRGSVSVGADGHRRRARARYESTAFHTCLGEPELSGASIDQLPAATLLKQR